MAESGPRSASSIAPPQSVATVTTGTASSLRLPFADSAVAASLSSLPADQRDHLQRSLSSSATAASIARNSAAQQLQEFLAANLDALKQAAERGDDLLDEEAREILRRLTPQKIDRVLLAKLVQRVEARAAILKLSPEQLRNHFVAQDTDNTRVLGQAPTRPVDPAITNFAAELIRLSEQTNGRADTQGVANQTRQLLAQYFRQFPDREKEFALSEFQRALGGQELEGLLNKLGGEELHDWVRALAANDLVLANTIMVHQTLSHARPDGRTLLAFFANLPPEQGRQIGEQFRVRYGEALAQAAANCSAAERSAIDAFVAGDLSLFQETAVQQALGLRGGGEASPDNLNLLVVHRSSAERALLLAQAESFARAQGSSLRDLLIKNAGGDTKHADLTLSLFRESAYSQQALIEYALARQAFKEREQQMRDGLGVLQTARQSCLNLAGGNLTTADKLTGAGLEDMCKSAWGPVGLVLGVFGKGWKNLNNDVTFARELHTHDDKLRRMHARCSVDMTEVHAAHERALDAILRQDAGRAAKEFAAADRVAQRFVGEFSDFSTYCDQKRYKTELAEIQEGLDQVIQRCNTAEKGLRYTKTGLAIVGGAAVVVVSGGAYAPFYAAGMVTLAMAPGTVVESGIRMSNGEDGKSVAIDAGKETCRNLSNAWLGASLANPFYLGERWTVQVTGQTVGREGLKKAAEKTSGTFLAEKIAERTLQESADGAAVYLLEKLAEQELKQLNNSKPATQSIESVDADEAASGIGRKPKARVVAGDGDLEMNRSGHRDDRVSPQVAYPVSPVQLPATFSHAPNQDIAVAMPRRAEIPRISCAQRAAPPPPPSPLTRSAIAPPLPAPVLIETPVEEPETASGSAPQQGPVEVEAKPHDIALERRDSQVPSSPPNAASPGPILKPELPVAAIDRRAPMADLGASVAPTIAATSPGRSAMPRAALTDISRPVNSHAVSPTVATTNSAAAADSVAHAPAATIAPSHYSRTDPPASYGRTDQPANFNADYPRPYRAGRSDETQNFTPDHPRGLNRRRGEQSDKFTAAPPPPPGVDRAPRVPVVPRSPDVRSESPTASRTARDPEQPRLPNTAIDAPHVMLGRAAPQNRVVDRLRKELGQQFSATLARVAGPVSTMQQIDQQIAALESVVLARAEELSLLKKEGATHSLATLVPIAKAISATQTQLAAAQQAIQAQARQIFHSEHQATRNDTAARAHTAARADTTAANDLGVPQSAAAVTISDLRLSDRIPNIVKSSNADSRPDSLLHTALAQRSERVKDVQTKLALIAIEFAKIREASIDAAIGQAENYQEKFMAVRVAQKSEWLRIALQLAEARREIVEIAMLAEKERFSEARSSTADRVPGPHAIEINNAMQITKSSRPADRIVRIKQLLAITQKGTEQLSVGAQKGTEVLSEIPAMLEALRHFDEPLRAVHAAREKQLGDQQRTLSAALERDSVVNRKVENQIAILTAEAEDLCRAVTLSTDRATKSRGSEPQESQRQHQELTQIAAVVAEAAEKKIGDSGDSVDKRRVQAELRRRQQQRRATRLAAKQKIAIAKASAELTQRMELLEQLLLAASRSSDPDSNEKAAQAIAEAETARAQATDLAGVSVPLRRRLSQPAS